MNGLIPPVEQDPVGPDLKELVGAHGVLGPVGALVRYRDVGVRSDPRASPGGIAPGAVDHPQEPEHHGDTEEQDRRRQVSTHSAAILCLPDDRPLAPMHP